MRLVLISDTHCRHRNINIPFGDILICAGDFCSYGKLSEVEVFGDWLSELPFEHIIVIAGNHDWPFVKDPKTARKLLGNVHYLQDTFVVIDNIKFYGSPWQPEFCNWAFNLPRGSQLKNIWREIPDDTDILITHGPPYGILDNTMRGEHVGCEDLLDRVLQIKPKLHVFGHIHFDYGINYNLSKDVTFVNASICDEGYLPTNQPVEFEI